MKNFSFLEWEAELNNASIRNQFEEKLSHFPGDESYFLLTTFANMALEREKTDYEFIHAATIDLFKVFSSIFFCLNSLKQF